jgi:hypothetical protein
MAISAQQNKKHTELQSPSFWERWWQGILATPARPGVFASGFGTTLLDWQDGDYVRIAPGPCKSNEGRTFVDLSSRIVETAAESEALMT